MQVQFLLVVKMKIAVPKGRIMKFFIKFLKRKNIYLKNYNKRKMLLKTNINFLKIVPIKILDSSFYLNKNHVDCCVLGSDSYYEEIKKYKNFLKKKINIFKCGFFLITRNKKKLIKNFYLKKKIIIYTKYKRIAKSIFKKKKYKIKKMNGNLELILYLKISDYIMDIVDTGLTLKKNNLIKLKKIKNIYSVLLINKNISKKNKKFLNKLFK
ncbi:ATP phosphoribosyltransferase [Candidatus Vidania fulgoroideorum]